METSFEKRERVGQWQAGVLRRLTGLLFYLVAAFGTLLSVTTLVMVRDLRQRHALTGDMAGADMALWFFLDELAPLTLLALVAGIWLMPPATWFGRSRRIGDRDTSPGPSSRMSRKVLAGVLSLGGFGILSFMARQLTDAIVMSYRFDDVRALALVGLVLRDLLVFSPMLTLAVVLFLSARRLVRTPR